MNDRRLRFLVLAGLLVALPTQLSAQQPPLTRTAKPSAALHDMLQNDPDPLPDHKGQTEPAPAQRKSGAGSLGQTVACSGVFGKNSDHIKLLATFGAKNVEYSEVDGPEGSKLMASVAFPKDPKRRLEILWNNEAMRADPQLIVISGQSAWAAPKGLRLGVALPALEKLNGKPFRLKGFGENGASVADWQGGALDKLPGGCKIGIRLIAGTKAPENVRTEVSGDKEFVSSDPKVRAMQPKIAEILLGY